MADLRHLHVRAGALHERGSVNVRLFSGDPRSDARSVPLARPLSVSRLFAADLLALIRAGAQARGLRCTADGPYYEQEHRPERHG
jgi:hypothetical protein